LGSAEHSWVAASAALDGLDEQIFVRGFLSKLTPTLRGLARVDPEKLSGGEQQLCLVLVSKALAIVQEEDGKRFYLLDQTIHELLLECLVTQGLPLRASATAGI
jgi:ABC-type hemin transport system ATPase subunit